MKTAEIRVENGTPRLFVNGAETPPILFALSDFPGAAANTAYARKNVAQFAREGVHVICADSEIRLGWHKRTPFEIEPIREELASVLEADPDAAVILRLHVNAPYWWLRDHPEEQVLYDGVPGEDDGDMNRLIRDDGLGRMRVSLASRKWLAEAGEIVRTLCTELRDTPEGQSLIGIQPACGLYGEWAHWGGGNDTSVPMQERFHRLLHERYPSDEALWAAWGMDGVTRDTAPLLFAKKANGDDGCILHPIESRAQMDAQLCLQTVLAEDILHFCRIVKEAWGRPILTGGFYGFIGSCHMLSGQLFAHRDVIDFLCSPIPYLANREPECVPMQRGLIESCRLHGMLWLTEMDQHPAGTENVIGGDPARLEETIGMLRRNTLQPLLAGGGMWYYDHRLIPRFVTADSRNPYAPSIYRKSGWWDNERLLSEIGAMARLASSRMKGAYRPAADVLLVYDPRSYFSVRSRPEREYEIQDAVMRAGASFDCIFLDDLALAQTERYRCVIFIAACAPDEAQRALMRKTAQKTVVWLYAPGYSHAGTLDAENIRSLTGFAVRRIDAEASYTTIGGGTHGLPGVSPMFAVTDPDAEPAAFFDSGETACARRGNAWYVGFPTLDPALMRRIFDAAGVHRYIPSGDPVFAGMGLIVIHTAHGCDTVLTLRNGVQRPVRLPPFTAAVFDAETGERIEWDPERL